MTNSQSATSGISPGLLRDIRDVLLRCPALESKEALRALFIDQRLAAWRHHVPEGSSPAKRVELLTDYLHDQTDAQGHGGLVLLLRVLSEKALPDHRLGAELAQLAAKLAGGDAAAHEVDDGLRASRQPPGMLLGVPPLPELEVFLERTVEVAVVKAMVLRSPTTAVTSVARRTAVQGMGGIGKSVLATALAHDEEIRMSFSDGVIWIPLGQEPDLTLRQAQVARALGDEPPPFRDTHEGRTYLSILMSTKHCLLILDDVWQSQHIAPFDIGVSGCRLLLTTRNMRVVSSVGATSYSLDLLENAQALTLLAQWSGRKVQELPDEAHKIMKACGHLPLALAMVGAMLREEPPRWAAVLHRLQNADLAKIRSQFPDYPYHDLLRAMQVSVEALGEEERARYLELAIFPKGSPIPEAALRVLWRTSGLDDTDTQELMALLVARSLAQYDEEGRLTLHDLQAAYLRKQIANLRDLHEQFLMTYRGLCPDGWSRGPEDGYFFEYLAYHLHHANWQADLRALLLEYRWVAAKLEATDINTLLADYEWQTADDPAVRCVQRALRQMGHILASDKAQLATQLIGRLSAEQIPEVQDLLSAAQREKKGVWLCPLSPSLREPDALVRTLAGHRKAVRGIAWMSQDRIVSAAVDGSLKVWDLDSGREIHTLDNHVSSYLNNVAVSWGGRHVIFTSQNNTLTVWEPGTPEAQMFTLHGHTRPIHGIAASDMYMLAISEDNILKVWKLNSYEPHRTFRLHGHADSVYGIAVSGNGYVISAASDGSLKVWNIETGADRTLQSHETFVSAVALSTDGTRAISASWDTTLKVWDLTKGQSTPIHTLKGHTRAVLGVAVDWKGGRILSASCDRTLKVWDLETGQLLHTLQGHIDWVGAVAVSEDGAYVLSASEDRTIRLWDLNSTKDLPRPQGHASEISGVALTRDGRYMVTGSEDSTLKVWDLALLQPARILEGHTSGVWDVAFAWQEQKRRIVSASSDGTLKVWDFDSGEELCTLQGHTAAISEVVVSADGRYAVSASEDSTLKVWDLETGVKLRTLRGHTREVWGVAISSEGQVISASGDCTLKIWDPRSGEVQRTLQGEKSIKGVAISEKDRYLIAADHRNLKVWDLDSGDHLRTLKGHERGILGVVVSADGDYVISASWDGTVRVWSTRTWQVLATCSTGDGLYTCMISPTEPLIIAAGTSGRLHFLRLEDGDAKRFI